MVKASCKISCDRCGHWSTRYNESGGTTGYREPFDCSHFHSSIYTDQNFGFWFGSNAMVYFEIDARCEKCKKRYNTWVRYIGYGTNNHVYNFSCCNNNLHIIFNKS